MSSIWGKRFLPALGAALLAVAIFGAAGSSAKTRAHRARLPYRAGTYSGNIAQQTYGGAISFVVQGHAVTNLVFTVAATCTIGGTTPVTLSVTDYDPASGVQATISRTGSFSYSGTVNGRQIRFRGYLHGAAAHGTFLQGFSLLDGACSMGQAAPFTAAH